MYGRNLSRWMILTGLALVIVALVGGIGGTGARASEFVLTEPVTYAQPECVSVDIRNKIFEQRIPRLRVTWRCLDVNGVPIPTVDTGEADRTFVCDGANSAKCTADNEPWDCCTGDGTGTCADADMCYADIADYVLQTAPAGLTFSDGFDIFIRNQLCEQTPQLTGKCGAFQ